MVDLGNLGGTFGGANALSASGHVRFSAIADDTESHAFSWMEKEGMVDLGTLGGGGFSSAAGVNAIGQVVGSSQTAADVAIHATLWR